MAILFLRVFRGCFLPPTLLLLFAEGRQHLFRNRLDQ
jgi:hypothetical protein